MKRGDGLTVHNMTTGARNGAGGLPKIMLDILDAGDFQL